MEILISLYLTRDSYQRRLSLQFTAWQGSIACAGRGRPAIMLPIPAR